MYKLSKIAVRLAYKIRHHRGHGIHSPFVFKLITNVIEEKKPYYAYNDIEVLLENLSSFKSNSRKAGRLLFRLVNFFNVKKILVLGSGEGIYPLYLTAPASDIVCRAIEPSAEKLNVAANLFKNWNKHIELSQQIAINSVEKQDCIVVDLNHYHLTSEEIERYLLKLICENSFIILTGLRTNQYNRLLWKSLVKLENVTVSLDLFHLGILFFNKKYHKKNYKLSF